MQLTSYAFTADTEQGLHIWEGERDLSPSYYRINIIINTIITIIIN